MKKTAWMVFALVLIMFSGTLSSALAENEQSGQMGNMMSGQGMMGQTMMGQQEMQHHDMDKRHHEKEWCPMGMMKDMPLCGNMLGKSMVPTEDGGVVVMIGNKLYKYDKNLKLEKEAEISIDYNGLKKMTINMQNMGMEMHQEKTSKSNPETSKGSPEK